jgi:hypothetical protein
MLSGDSSPKQLMSLSLEAPQLRCSGVQPVPCALWVTVRLVLQRGFSLRTHWSLTEGPTGGDLQRPSLQGYGMSNWREIASQFQGM